MSCLWLGLFVLGSLPTGVRAGVVAPAGGELPAPQWVGGADARGKAQLTWIRNPAFASVRLYRRDEGQASPFRLLIETKQNTWLDAAVQPGRPYVYRLSGIGADGREGPPSAELAVRIGVVTHLPAAAPEWEGSLSVADGIGLKWLAREGEEVIAWNVYRRGPSETELRLIGSARGTSFHDTDVEPGQQYVYALTALDATFTETPQSKELPVTFTRPPAHLEPQGRSAPWSVRRTRLVALVKGGDLPLESPADVAVGPLTGNAYVADSGRNLVVVFSPAGVFQRTVGAKPGGGSIFKNLLGLAMDRDENVFVVDAGAGAVQSFTPLGRPGRRVELPRRGLTATGLIDAAVGADGRVFVVDNFNNHVVAVGSG